MNSKFLNAILALLCVALALYSFQQYQTIKLLKFELESISVPPPSQVKTTKEPTPSPQAAATEKDSPRTPTTETSSPNPAGDRSADNQRIMRDFAQMFENPQMNEIMQASQRGTLEVIYKDLIESFDFTPEERQHFMDLLMARQMFRVETSMKMMGGQSDPEERAFLSQEMKDYDELVKEEINTFLNDQGDSGKFDFYEKTIQERMSLSGMKAELARANMPLEDGVDEKLIQIMADQKANYDFYSDLADDENYNLDSNRFSLNNIDAFEADLSGLHALIEAEAAAILTPEQLNALTASLAQMRQLQISQLKMAANMFSNPEG